MVHTNYDEYAITLTKKLSHHRGPTITAKLYGKGLELDMLTAAGGGRRPVIEGQWSRAGRSREFHLFLLIKLQLQDS